MLFIRYYLYFPDNQRLTTIFRIHTRPGEAMGMLMEVESSICIVVNFQITVHVSTSHLTLCKLLYHVDHKKALYTNEENRGGRFKHAVG